MINTIILNKILSGTSLSAILLFAILPAIAAEVDDLGTRVSRGPSTLEPINLDGAVVPAAAAQDSNVLQKAEENGESVRKTLTQFRHCMRVPTLRRGQSQESYALMINTIRLNNILSGNSLTADGWLSTEGSAPDLMSMD